MRTVQVAGGIVIGPQGRVLVVEQRWRSWSFPKGHHDPPESLLETAIREIGEETGVHELTFITELGCYERQGGGTDTADWKEITLFLFSTAQQELSPKDETNPDAQWVDIDNIESRLSYVEDKQFFLIVREDVKRAMRNLCGK